MSATRGFAWLGPVVATVLAFGIGAISLHYVGAERLKNAREGAASLAAKQVSRTPSLIRETRAKGYQVSIVGDDPEPRQYRYLHQLVFVDHQTRPGQRLAPPKDRDDADAWRRGRQGRMAWTQGSMVTAVAPIAGGRVAIVRADREPLSFAGTWWGGAVGCLIMLFLWRALYRSRRLEPKWSAALGPIGVLIVVLGMLWIGLREVDGVLSQLDALANSNWTADVSAMVTVVALPMVWIAVHGFIREGAPSPHRLAYAYIAPAIIGLGVLVLLPFVFGIVLAFFRYDGDHFTWVGLQHFVDILSSRDYPITHPLSFYFTLGFTILWTGLNVALHVGIGLGLALLLNRPSLRFKGVYRVLLIIPWAVPSYITALIWRGMFNQQFGLINAVLGHLGIEPVGWFSGFWTAFVANLSTNTWLGFPFMMVVALGALQSIPKDLYEAARVDGANAWQQFRNITLPLLRPALLPAVIMGTVWTFNMFNIVYLVSGGRPEGSTDILITEAYRWAFERERYGYAAAYSLLIFFVLLGYSLLTQRVGQSAEEGTA